MESGQDHGFSSNTVEKFLSGELYRMWNTILSDELGYKFPAVLTGGSVTSDAFMIADYIGFRKSFW